MILIINICKHEMHFFEFVKPVMDIVRGQGAEATAIHYKELEKKDIDRAEKIIICGTSLKDNRFLKDIEKFSWIKQSNKAILGICGGMQIVALLFGGEIERGKEIGIKKTRFEKSFLGTEGEKEVYELHKNIVNNVLGFEVLARNEFIQAVKHREKEIYGVLFHAEARNKELVENFLKIEKI